MPCSISSGDPLILPQIIHPRFVLIICYCYTFISAIHLFQNWRFGQKEVPGSLRSHSWTVLLPHQEENQPETGRRALLLREQRDPTHLRHHGLLVPGAPRRGLFPVHCTLRRVCVRRGVEKLFICLRQLSAKLDPFEAKRFRARLSQKFAQNGNGDSTVALSFYFWQFCTGEWPNFDA